MGPYRALAESVLAASPLLFQQQHGVASAFLTQTPSTPLRIHEDRLRIHEDSTGSRGWKPLQMAVADDEGNDLADFSAARRRILFSMLATASSVPLMASGGAVDEAVAASADVPAVAASAAAAVAFFAKLVIGGPLCRYIMLWLGVSISARFARFGSDRPLRLFLDFFFPSSFFLEGTENQKKIGAACLTGA